MVMTGEGAEPVTACRGCGAEGLRQVLDLGSQAACDYYPAADDAGPDPRWPLALTLCQHCGLLQLDHRSPAPEEPRAVESATLQRHAREAVDRVLARLPQREQPLTVKEFASHHGGSWHDALLAAGCEPVETDAGLVIDNHSIIHAEDLSAELQLRADAVSDDGYLVIEFHHAYAQLVHAQFDTVRHGHPLYFSLHSWQTACDRVGFSVIDAWREDVFGGCLVAVARRGQHPPSSAAAAIFAEEEQVGLTRVQGFADLAERTAQIVRHLRQHLQQAAAEGRRVLAYGAGSKACTLLGVAGVTAAELPLVADLSPAKHGRRIPVVGTEIISPERLLTEDPDEVLILTWDIAAEVSQQLRGMGLRRATFMVAMPVLSALGD